MELAGKYNLSVLESRVGARLSEILEAMDMVIKRVCVIGSGKIDRKKLKERELLQN